MARRIPRRRALRARGTDDPDIRPRPRGQPRLRVDRARRHARDRGLHGRGPQRRRPPRGHEPGDRDGHDLRLQRRAVRSHGAGRDRRRQPALARVLPQPGPLHRRQGARRPPTPRRRRMAHRRAHRPLRVPRPSHALDGEGRAREGHRPLAAHEDLRLEGAAARRHDDGFDRGQLFWRGSSGGGGAPVAAFVALGVLVALGGAAVVVVRRRRARAAPARRGGRPGETRRARARLHARRACSSRPRPRGRTRRSSTPRPSAGRRSPSSRARSCCASASPSRPTSARCRSSTPRPGASTTPAPSIPAAAAHGWRSA